MEPVTVKNKPNEILEAFKAKPPGAPLPYWQLLTPEQQKKAEDDPVAWLKTHPYLHEHYPILFGKEPEHETVREAVHHAVHPHTKEDSEK